MQLVINKMKKIIYYLTTVLLLVFWPLTFYLANVDSWITYAMGISILFLSLVFYQKGFPEYYFIYLLLPFIHPAFLAFPFITLVFKLIFNRTSGVSKATFAIFLLLLVLVTIFAGKGFYAHSIFTPDPLAYDTLNKKISLIPSRSLAKVFENKTTIFQDKFKSNVFISLDPNNYFFNHHPQEIGGNQNLIKYSYLAIIPFLVGLYFILESKNKEWTITTLVCAVISVAFINNQDRFDTLLYLPISLICLHGLKKIFQSPNHKFWLFSAVFIPTSLIELARIILIK